MEGFDHEPIDPIGLINYHFIFIRTWGRGRGAIFFLLQNVHAGSCTYPYIQIDKSNIYIYIHTQGVSTDSDGINSYDHVPFCKIQIK